MSIVPVSRLVLVGAAEDKQEAIEGLQALGSVHLLPLREAGPLEPPDRESQRRAVSAWRHLQAATIKRRPWPSDEKFDPGPVVDAALKNKTRLASARERVVFLTQRLGDVEPFGDFTLPKEPPGGHKLWFYIVPVRHRKVLEGIDVPWAVVGREANRLHVALISKDEPAAEILPVPRTHMGSQSLSELRAELEEAEIELELAEAEQGELSRHRVNLGIKLAAQHDADDRLHAAGITLERPRLFAISGWLRKDRAQELQAWALDKGLAVSITDPEPGDAPPTLLETDGELSGATALTTFYMTPAYRDWDPSLIVFGSFAIFFAMILADAGYAAVLGVLLLAYWARLGTSEGGRRLRVIMAGVLGTAFVYGVLAGSYFSVAPPKGSILGDVAIIDVTNIHEMMKASIVIGVLHIALANVAAAWRNRGWARVERLGWVSMVIGGLVVWLGPHMVGGALVVAGALAVFVGAAMARPQPKSMGVLMRLLGGASALTRVSRLFGDVLSYMRLFALGLSSASLGATFNGIAGEINAGVPGAGLLLAALVLAFGHGINLALGIMSGVVHGLRLNVLEFFGWGLSEEGYPFKAFARREAAQWTS